MSETGKNCNWCKQRWGKMIFAIGKVVLACVIIFMLIKNADRSWFAFTVDWHWLITAAGVLLLQNVIIVLRWQYLLKLAGIKLSFFEAFSLTMQGLFFMLFIPGGAASGDLIKIALVATPLLPVANLVLP